MVRILCWFKMQDTQVTGCVVALAQGKRTHLNALARLEHSAEVMKIATGSGVVLAAQTPAAAD